MPKTQFLCSLSTNHHHSQVPKSFLQHKIHRHFFFPIFLSFSLSLFLHCPITSGAHVMIQTAFTSFCCSKSISTHIHETCSLHVINSILTIPITLLTTTFYLPYAPSLLISNLSSSFLSHGVGAWTCGSCFDLLGLLRA